MNEIEWQDLQNLIRRVVQRVVQEQGLAVGASPQDGNGTALSTQQSALSTPTSGRVLVAVCCEECLNPQSLAALEELKAARFEINQPAEEEFKTRATRERLVEESDIVLLPAVGDDDAAKMALGVFDEPVARVALSALAVRKPLVAALNAPYDALLQRNSPVLRRVFEGYRRVLQNYGFQIVEYSQVAAAVREHCLPAAPSTPNGTTFQKTSGNGKKQLITAQDVDEAARAGRRLQLPPGALVTPLARDRARELGLNID